MSKIKNKYSDLNNILFEQMERLNDCTNDEELKKEVSRSKAMTDVAGKIIENGALVIEAERLRLEYRTDAETQPRLTGFIEE